MSFWNREKDILKNHNYLNEAKSDLPDDIELNIIMTDLSNNKKLHAHWSTPQFIIDQKIEQGNRIESLIDKAVSGRGDSDRHLITLFATCLGSHSRNILELGVRRGDTTTPLLMAAKLNSGIVDSVDINDTEFECPEDLKPFWRFHKSDAIKYLEQCVADGRKFDFIYLDDWHSYRHTKREFELIDQLVTPSTVIWVHDAMYANDGKYHMDLTLRDLNNQWAEGGICRTLMELDPQFWEMSTLSYNHGLSLVRKKYSSKY